MRGEALGASSSAADYPSEYRGAGGKISRRSFSRKPPSTPYDRPLTQQHRSGSTGGGGGWMSKIVNPAYRLIAGGASHLLRSVFSSSSVDSLPAPSYPEASEEELEQGTRSENQEPSIHPWMSKSTVGEDRKEQEGRPDVSRSAEVERARSHLIGDPDISSIEQLIKGKTFCREEIDCLMGILQSRVVDADGGLISNEHTTEEADKLEIPLGNLESENEEKQENLDEVRHANPEPPSQQMANEEIGASPIELAKAYMGSRAFDYDSGSKSHVPRNDRLLHDRSEFPSSKFLAPPSPKSSICWPGAIAQEQHDYLKPHSQQGRYGLDSHLRTPYSRTPYSRTPYSRTIYSKSKSKLTPLEADSRKPSGIITTSIQKQSPFYEEPKINVTEDVPGSAGPIRRLRHKFVSETPRRGSPSLWTSQKGSPQVKESSIFGDNPLTLKQIEPVTIGTSTQLKEHKGLSEAGSTPLVHPHTSKHARQILEQISRTPTPKEMSEELKLAIGKKKSTASEVSGAANDTRTTSYVGGFLPDKKKEDNPFFKVPSVNLPTGSINGVSGESTSRSKTLQQSGFSFPNIRPSPINQGSTQATDKGPIAATNPSLGTRNQEVNLHKSRTQSGNKPVLPPISVDKSAHRVKFAAENCGSGFTFPVAASSRALEPPTPSVMPFSSTSSLSPPRYAFGQKKSAATGTLVFSFPWISNSSTLNDTPEFKFGSDERRLSFGSIGKDTALVS